MASVVFIVPERGSRRKMPIHACRQTGKRWRRIWLRERFLQLGLACVRQVAELSFITLGDENDRSSSHLTTLKAGIAVPLMGSFPEMLNERTLAVAVLSG